MRKLLKRTFMFPLLFLWCIVANAQQAQVSGTVTAQEDNAPLQGVTVTNQNTNQRAQTNSAGYFQLAAEKGHVLVFTYVGFVRQEITVGDSRTINIRMVEGKDQMGEVVVTAYGMRQNKRELSYQAVTVSGDEIASTRRENFVNSLAGRIPGAMITSTTGMPGSSTSIVLRGPTSIDGNNQPIFVVDGLIIDNSAFEMKDRLPSSALNIENRSNDFANRAMDINPEDIESVTILKGPEATSLYGSDGANGAIVITTKKGKKGRASVSYNNSFRVEKIYRLPKIQTVYDQGVAGITNPVSRSFFGQKIPEGTQLFDNLGSFFRTGKTQQHNLSVDGGGDMGTYRFTGSYVNQNGVVPNTGFERYNFRLNTTFKLSSKINLTNTFSYIQSRTDKASKGAESFLLSLLSWPSDDNAFVYLDSTGNRRTIAGDFNAAEVDNPFWDVNRNISFDENNRLMGNFQFSYDAAKWLNLTALMGIDYYNTRGTWFFHPQSNVARTSGGILNQYRETQRLLNGAYRATIRKKIGDVNNTLIGAFTFDSRKYEVNSIKGERLYEPTFMSINNTDPLTVASRTTAENFNRFGTFLTYNGSFKNWWNVSLSGRLDGSSRLVDPQNFQMGDALYAYWSVGTSLIVSDMLKLPSSVRYAKVRFNYATTGRDPRTAYVKANSYNPSTFTGGGFAPGFTQGNPDLRPEFSQQMEIGAEAKFFDNRFGFDVALYDNRVKDQLTAFRLSYASGAIIKWVNGGTVQNRGIELQLTGTPIRSKNLNWDITVNFSRNRNEILEMPPNVVNFYNSDTWIGNIRNNVTKGGNIYELSANRYQRNSRGDILISPTSGFPMILGDYTPVGDRQPDFNMGIQNTFSFLKNWNLSFLLDIRRGGDVYNGTEEYLYRRGLSLRTLDRETPRIVKGVLADGLQNTDNPTINNIVITPFYRSEFYTLGSTSEDFIEKDIHWLRMRDITLSFSLPATLIKRQKLLKSASLFITGTDVFIVTNYSGADPAVNANNVSARGGIGGIGMDQGNLAPPRGINFGLRASF